MLTGKVVQGEWKVTNVTKLDAEKKQIFSVSIENEPVTVPTKDGSVRKSDGKTIFDAFDGLGTAITRGERVHSDLKKLAGKENDLKTTAANAGVTPSYTDNPLQRQTGWRLQASPQKE